VGGVVLGNKLAQTNADSNMDLRFRDAAAEQAKAALIQQQDLYGAGLQASGMKGGQLNRSGLMNAYNVIAAIKINDQSVRPRWRPQPRASAEVTPQGETSNPSSRRPRAKRKGRRPTAPSDVEFQFAQEERRADMDILQAKMDLSHDIDERAKLSSLRCSTSSSTSRDAEIDHRVQPGAARFRRHKITKATLDEVVAQAAILKQKGDESDALKRQLILEQAEEDRQRQAAEIEQHSFELRGQLLQKEADLAETASERRAIELQLLELAYQEKRLALSASSTRARTRSRSPTRARIWSNSAPITRSTGKASFSRPAARSRISGEPADHAAKWTEALQNVAVQRLRHARAGDPRHAHRREEPRRGVQAGRASRSSPIC
jgi:hypothetical protein